MLAPRSVALAFGPDAAALDLAGPMDVFSAATAMLGEGAGYRLLLVSRRTGRCACLTDHACCPT